MKKKLLVAVLLLSVLLGGCGGSRDVDFTTEENTDTWEDDAEYRETEHENTDTDYNEDAYEEPEEAVVETYQFTKPRPFSNGRAWVDFPIDHKYSYCTGVIDTDGKLVYQADSQLFYVSQFQDGLAFYREDDTVEAPCGIIDVEGNVLFESKISPDGGYLILAYGNGHFFAAQHIQSFDTDEWRYGTIDKNGNVLNEMQASDENFDLEDWVGDVNTWPAIRYIGENFIVLPSGLYNISTAHFSSFPGWNMEKTVGDFYEGYTAIALDGDDFAYIIDTNYEEEPCEYHDELQNVVSKKEEFHSDSSYGEGLIFGNEVYSDGIGYYDKDWNLAISLEQYKENRIKGGAFSGGFAPITMQGADGDWYAAVIDRQGNLAYSPVRIDQVGLNNFQNGYFQVTIDGETKIIEPDGKVSTPGVDDLSMLNGLSFGGIDGNSFLALGGVGDGLICCLDVENNIISYSYARADGSGIIDCVKLMSGSTGSDAEFQTDSYIIPDSYDITGKWKSVGESGFGQAQPGAVIVFDENRCNFYSPNDTYAFSFDGEKYVLALTTPLGESLEKTVDIIDDDNIEIAGTSLKRIE